MTAGAAALLLVVGGGTAAVAGLLGGDEPATRIVTAVGQPAQAAPATGGKPAAVPHRATAVPPAEDEVAALPRTAEQADRTATRAPRQAADAAPAAPKKAAPAPQASGGPVVTTREETETREIPFRTRLVRDPALARGVKRVQAPGMPGEETLRYLVTVVDGEPAERRLVETSVTREPQHRVVAIGTAVATPTHPGPECGKALTVCVPLGRSAMCPKKKKHREESGGAVIVLDQDLAGLDAKALADLEVC